MARILVIDESQQRAVEICSGLITAGHQVAAVLPSALELVELVERIEEIKPDIILIETESPSRDTLEHLAVMHRDMPRPVVMFSQDGERGTIRSASRCSHTGFLASQINEPKASTSSARTGRIDQSVPSEPSVWPVVPPGPVTPRYLPNRQ